MKRLVLAAVAISLVLAPGIGAAAGPCGVGCTIEVRDDAIVGSARETEVRVGVPVLWRLTGSRGTRDRLGAAPLPLAASRPRAGVRGDSLCVEARSGLDGRWSEWANTCRVV